MSELHQMKSNNPDARHQVTYRCSTCGHGFLVGQNESSEPDEDIDICFDCIDMLFENEEQGPLAHRLERRGLYPVRTRFNS